jgi:hypothetical protein
VSPVSAGCHAPGSPAPPQGSPLGGSIKINQQSLLWMVLFEIDEVPDWVQNYGMGQAELPTCPICGAHLILALPPGGDRPRIFRCLECDGPDPLKNDKATGWLKGELRPPE